MGGYSGGDALHRARNLFPHPTVIPRAGGVSSTPRPPGSITDVSGILDRPPQCAIAHKADDDGEHTFTFPRRVSPGLCQPFRPKQEGAGNAGCLLHPRSRVQEMVVEAHTSIQVQSEHSGIPCAMVLRFMARSPRRRIPLASVIGELTVLQTRLGLRKPLSNGYRFAPPILRTHHPSHCWDDV